MSSKVDERPGTEWQEKAAFVVPLLLFFVLGMVIDTEPTEEGQAIDAGAYQTLVIARVVLMTMSIGYFFRWIHRIFPVAVDAWGIVTGVVGAVVWIGLCSLQLESTVVAALGVPANWLPAREGVDPFATYGGNALIVFLVTRFALLVVCVPIAEELFLRGFVMRAIEAEDWPRLPLQQIGRTGLVIGTVYGVASHPGEVVAAAAWFSMVTWLMVKTGKFWNCVVAHAITNGLLGIYVCVYSQWHLW